MYIYRRRRERERERKKTIYVPVIFQPDENTHYMLSEADGFSNLLLVIESVVIEDEGKYKCQASSVRYPGPPAEKLVMVRVRGKCPLQAQTFILDAVQLQTFLATRVPKKIHFIKH